MTNCILGFSTYAWDNCGIFVRGLRESGYADDLILVGNSPGEEYEKRYNIIVKPLARPDNIVMDRFDYYLEILKESDYDKVMLTDVRDVVFQADPFPLVTHGLQVTEEDLLVGEQRHNRDRCKEGFGIDGFNFLKDKRIICAGTIFGSREGVMGYIKEFNALASQNAERDRLNLPHITDQAALIHLVHTGKLDYLDVGRDVNDGHHTVWTIGTRDETHVDIEFYTIDGHTIKMMDGHIPAVVHQYDRHPKIVKALEDYYLGSL